MNDCYCYLHQPYMELKKKRERDMSEILRNLTECLKDRTKDVDRLTEELKKQSELLYQERKRYKLLMQRCERLQYSLMCTDCKAYHDLPRSDGTCVESLKCKVCNYGRGR